MRSVLFTPQGWEDYRYWFKQDNKTLKKISKLIDDTCREAFDGLGKPEPLKNNLSSLWSRRIDDNNRLVYAVTDSEIKIVTCRFHY